MPSHHGRLIQVRAVLYTCRSVHNVDCDIWWTLRPYQALGVNVWHSSFYAWPGTVMSIRISKYCRIRLFLRSTMYR